MSVHTMLKTLLRTEEFFDVMNFELSTMFPNGWYTVYDDDIECNVASTQGWKHAFERTCNKFDLEDILKEYNNFSATTSDIFDLRLSELIILHTVTVDDANIPQLDEFGVKIYSDFWNDFVFREPVYMFNNKPEDIKFDLVKYASCKPRECIDLKTGVTKISTRHCFTVGTLYWNSKDCYFEFKSCGMRYFDYHISGLENYVKQFAESMSAKLIKEQED